MKTLIVIFNLIIFSCFSYSQENTTSIKDFIDKLNQDSITLTLKELTGEIKVKINADSIYLDRRNTGNNPTTQYLFKKLQSFGFNPTIVNCYNDFTFVQNVITTLEGSDFHDKKIIFSAHYDCESPDSLAPGADDNASGTALVLEAARILKDFKPKYSIIFALWDAEEWGLYGSACYASNAKNHSENILAVINSDMLAYDYNNYRHTKICLRNDKNSLLIWNKIKILNQLCGINLNLDSTNSEYSGSDAISFWEKGFSAVSFSEAILNPSYHSNSDLIKLFDFTYYMLNARLAFATLLDLAETGLTTQIETPINNFNFTITNNYIEIFSTQLPKNTQAIITIFNILGNQLFSKTIIDNSNQFSIDLSNLPAGLYFINFSFNNNTFTKKFLKTY